MKFYFLLAIIDVLILIVYPFLYIAQRVRRIFEAKR